MAAKTLSKFTLAKKGESYSVHIEDDDGEVTQFEASAEQLDVIADEIAELLDEDDSVADEDED